MEEGQDKALPSGPVRRSQQANSSPEVGPAREGLEKPAAWRRARLAAVATLILLLVATIGARAWAERLVADEANARFHQDVNQVQAAIERETLVYVEALRGARGFVAQSELVTYGEWHGYVAMLDVEHRYRALRGLSLNAYIPALERTAFEERIRNDSSLRGAADPDFSIRPPGNRDFYVVIQYIAPVEGNAGAVGFDIASEPVRARAVQRALQTGNASATAPIPLVQTNETRMGILILLPVEPGGAAGASGGGSRPIPEFFVVAVVDPDELVAQALAGVDKPIALRLTDQGSVDGLDEPEPRSRIIYESDGTVPSEGGSADHRAVAALVVGGRLWTLDVESPHPYAHGLSAAAPLGIAVVGLPVSVLAAAFVYVQLTRRARAVHEAQRLTLQLRESEARRALLTSGVAHELNAALTPIIFQLHMLKSMPQLEKRANEEAWVITDRNVDHLQRLVGDLLDVARMEEGRLRLHPTPFDLADLVGRVVAEFRPIAEAKKVNLETAALEGVQVVADAQRIHQVLRNLFSNGIKFTPAGGRIEVRMDVKPQTIQVSVSDSGRGLTREEIGRLFQPYAQIHEPTREVPRGTGTGLGLYLSRGLIEANGGLMGCESAGRGSGATFWFSLPTAPGLR